MAKFVIECPSCGKYTQASNFIFAKKRIDCTCGYTIDVRTDKMSSRLCAHCGNNVVFDQSKGDKARCPVCKTKINSSEQIFNKVEFSCPTCSCRHTAEKNAAQFTCPLCDTLIQVQSQVAKEKARKQGVVSVIKYEGSNDTFVWKHPLEDFNLGSQLIVHESQEAIFFRDGQALDLFGAGRHTLITQNIPLIGNLINLPFDGNTMFHSEVYYINQTVQMGIKWGTDSKVRMFDPATGLHLELGACGQFSLRVFDSRRILLKLVGTASEFTQADVIDGDYKLKPTVAKFKALIMTKVKSNLARIIKENAINVLEIDEHLDVLSEKLRDSINENLVDYGLVMPDFFVTAIMTPDDDPNFRRLKQQHADMYLKVREQQILSAEARASAEREAILAETAARLKIIDAQGNAEAYKLKAAAEAEEMRMKGYTYQDETARMVGVGAVESMGNMSGGVGGLGDLAGLGMSLGAIGGVMNLTKDAMAPLTDTTIGMGSTLGTAMTPPQTDTWNCSCGNQGITANFCGNCGGKKPAPAETWDCTCGNRGITGNFCGNCGARKPEAPRNWDCACGKTGNTGNFCDICGNRRSES